ncbi:MAG TPA: YoaK family protein [Polyangiaceae bacterium]|nr:YoaK family protein [Polyangiaceae bacterium]
MFSREGSARTDGQNRVVAGYLAFVGGFVNSCGFVLIGTFTSHVTGNVGRLANDAALGHYAAAVAALTMVLFFFGGAFCASVIVESRFLGGPTSRAYASALALEALLLVLFTALSYLTSAAAHPRVQDAEAALLCAAMGLQNALVTRLSGAVVRTTHLTGVITDLGIECARWFRFWGKSEGGPLPQVFGPNVAERPTLPKVLLLGTIAGAFFVGATAGAFSATRLHHASMLAAAAAVGVFAILASRSG